MSVIVKNKSTAKEGKQEFCDKQQNTRRTFKRVKMSVMQLGQGSSRNAIGMRISKKKVEA
jgi:hypothetical protein